MTSMTAGYDSEVAALRRENERLQAESALIRTVLKQAITPSDVAEIQRENEQLREQNAALLSALMQARDVTGKALEKLWQRWP